ncbi:hypothetical protein PS2_006511 [Malus domestica]
MGYSQGFNVSPIGVVGRLSLWWHEPREIQAKRRKLFKFEAFWPSDEGCMKVIEKSWRVRGGRSQLQNNWEDYVEEIKTFTVAIDKLEQKIVLFWRQRSYDASINRIVNEHFTNLFTTGGRREWESVIECVHPTVSDEMNSHLTRLVTLEEIKEVVFQMGGMKALGRMVSRGFSTIHIGI